MKQSRKIKKGDTVRIVNKQLIYNLNSWKNEKINEKQEFVVTKTRKGRSGEIFIWLEEIGEYVKTKDLILTSGKINLLKKEMIKEEKKDGI